MRLLESLWRVAVKFQWAPVEFVGTPKEFMNFSQFLTQGYMGFVLNGQKLDATTAYPGAAYTDPFGWLPFAKDGGSTTFNGTAVHEWTLSSPAATNSLLVDQATGEPVFQSINATYPGVGRYAQHNVYSEWRADESHLAGIWCMSSGRWNPSNAGALLMMTRSPPDDDDEPSDDDDEPL